MRGLWSVRTDEARRHEFLLAVRQGKAKSLYGSVSEAIEQAMGLWIESTPEARRKHTVAPEPVEKIG